MRLELRARLPTDILWQNGHPGEGTTRVLFDATSWLLTQHFGFQGREEKPPNES